jgi:hypothetical protein
MKVDRDKSIYSEDPAAKDEFNRAEMRRLQFLLRRLQFLEAQVRERGGLTSSEGNGGGAFAEWEIEALEFVLDELRFLKVEKKQLERNGA